MYNICKNCEAENSIEARYCSKCGYQLPEISITDNSKNFASKEIKSKPEKENKKKILISVVVTVIAFFIAFFSVQYFMSSNSKIDKQFTEIASEINKNCPILVDRDTQLNNVITLPNKTIQYNYTLINYTRADINIEEAKKFVFDNSLNTIINSPEMEYLRSKDAIFYYSYKDKNGEFLFKVKVKPEDYKN